MIRTTRWQFVAAAILLTTSVAVVYGRILRDLAGDWATDGNYSHGFVVVPFAAWVLWDRRRELARAALRPHPAGLAVVAGSLLLLAAGTLGVEQFLARISLIGVLAGTILFVCGPEHLRLVAFPALLLVLAIPLPAIVMNQIALPLQSLTSRGAAALLGALSVPVLREGNMLLLPHAALEVEEACSGLRSIMALLTIGAVAGYLSRRRIPARVVLALVTVPIAVVASAIRVAVLGVGAHYFGVDVVHSPLHGAAGVSVFMVTCALVLLVDSVVLRGPRLSREELLAC